MVGINPKINNMLPGYKSAVHQLIWISDSNVKSKEVFFLLLLLFFFFVFVFVFCFFFKVRSLHVFTHTLSRFLHHVLLGNG